MENAAEFEWLPTAFRNIVIQHRTVDSGFAATVRTSASWRVATVVVVCGDACKFQRVILSFAAVHS